MGGPGSGQWYRCQSKSTVEGTRYLDAGELRQKGVIVPGTSTAGTWSWRDARTGAARASLGYACTAAEDSGWLRLCYTLTSAGESRAMDYAVELVSVPSNLGRGAVWYFLCPGQRCGRRVKRLYAGRWIYACRHCYDLVHQSTRESHRARRLAAMLAGDLPGIPQDVLASYFGMLPKDDQRLYSIVGSMSRLSQRVQRMTAQEAPSATKRTGGAG